jgi:hypothetical protein
MAFSLWTVGAVGWVTVDLAAAFRWWSSRWLISAAGSGTAAQLAAVLAFETAMLGPAAATIGCVGVAPQNAGASVSMAGCSGRRWPG